MASLDRKHVPYLIYVYIDKRQKKINTGLKNLREAERMAEHITKLENACKNGLTTLDADLAGWVNRLEKSNSKVYEKLVSLGLLEQKARPVTVADISDITLNAPKRKRNGRKNTMTVPQKG